MSPQFWGTASINLPRIALAHNMLLKPVLRIVQWFSQTEGVSWWLDCHHRFFVLIYFLKGFSPWLVWGELYFTVEAEQGCRWSWARSATFITSVKTDHNHSGGEGSWALLQLWCPQKSHASHLHPQGLFTRVLPTTSHILAAHSQDPR